MPEIYDSAPLTLDKIGVIFKKAGERGLDVARIHSGDPSIYGAINEQMRLLDEFGIAYEVIPGISSFQAASAALCQELTLPGFARQSPLREWAAIPLLRKRRPSRRLSRRAPHSCCFFRYQSFVKSSRP